MHRLLVETRLLGETSPELEKDAQKHLKVLRPEDGERFELFDGKGAYRIYEYSAKSAMLKAASNVTEASLTPKPLTLFASITKSSRWDWTIEKATELGVTRIVPVITDRTIVRIPPSERSSKKERWIRIAQDAARQSDAKFVPEILEALDFKDSLKLVKETSCLIGALTTPTSPHISKAEGNAVFIGPEGDFTPEELNALMNIASPVSFGPTILRAETAAIFAISVLSAKLNG